MKITRYADASGEVKYAGQGADGIQREIAGDLFGSYKLTDRPAHIHRALAPISPVNIICIGLNYRRHAAESNQPFPQWPVVFMKATSALRHPGAPIQLPRHLTSDEVDYECELAVIIGRTCKNVSRESALENVLGYTCANDVSARDWQSRKGGSQWCRGKTFDTFCPLGPCLVTGDELGNPNDLTIKTIINGQVFQDWNTNDMIFDVPALIEFLSGSTTLLAGTVILTGTPHGVGFAQKPPRWLVAGDKVDIEISKIGTLCNPVELEPVG